MNRKIHHQVTTDFTARRHKLMFEVKNADYADDDEALANFKERADLLGLTPLQIALVDASKHFQKIARAARGIDVERAEPLARSFDDLGNYIDLAHSIYSEKAVSTSSMAAKEVPCDFTRKA